MLRNRERGPFGAPFQTGFTNRMASRRDCLLTANPGDAPGAPFFRTRAKCCETVKGKCLFWSIW